MSIASEMKKLADENNGELSFSEKHQLLATIKAAASEGKYAVVVRCSGQYLQMVEYLTKRGFLVTAAARGADGRISALHVCWEAVDE